MLFKYSIVLISIFLSLNQLVKPQFSLRQLLFPWITGPPSVPAFRQPLPEDILKVSPYEIDRAGRPYLLDGNSIIPYGLTVQEEDFQRPVRFFLYPDYKNWNYTEEIVPWDKESLAKSHYNPKWPLLLVLHGFFSNDDTPERENKVIINAYLEAGFPANIVGVDWGQLINRLTRAPRALISQSLYYFDVIPNIPKATTIVGDFIIFLTQSQLLSGPENVHLVGFSLGAQLAGLVGQDIKRRIGRRIYRITGLDPAGPEFNGQGEDERLSSDDADFVDVLHTNQGVYGYLGRQGHVDWFLNGGGPGQPGCSLRVQSLLIERCQHERAFYYFADSIKGVKYLGCRCINKQCLKDYSGHCTQPSLFGEYADHSLRGGFFLEIARNPYSRP